MNSAMKNGNFSFGDPKKEKEHPTKFSIPKVIKYMNENGKRFDELTEEEIEKLK